MPAPRKPARKPKKQAWTRHDRAAVAYRAKYGLQEGKLGQ